MTSTLNVKRLNRAIRRQQTVQRSRALAWCLFAVCGLVALSAWVGGLGVIGRTELRGGWWLLLTAIAMTGLAVKMLKAGRRFNGLLRDSETLLARAKDREELLATQWGLFLPWAQWWRG